VTSSFFSVKTGLDASRSSGAFSAFSAAPSAFSSLHTATDSEGGQQAGSASPAPNPLVEAKEENGEAEARFVVGAALVNGVEDAGLELGFAVLFFRFHERVRRGDQNGARFFRFQRLFGSSKKRTAKPRRGSWSGPLW
jgi:hypothetical protein